MPRFIANEPLFIGRHRAHNEGDEVPAQNLRRNGWADKVTQIDDEKPDEKPEKPEKPRG